LPKSLTETEKAWLASAIDGEGSILIVDRIDRGWRAREVIIVVTNTDIRYAERARELLDGSVYTTPGKGRRKPYHRASQSNHTKVELILSQILPYLIIKREKAERALRFIASTDWGRRNERSPTRRGWTVDEERILGEVYPTMRRPSEIASLFHSRNWAAIRDKAERLDLRRPRWWTSRGGKANPT